jgi:hypothetical protein
LKNLARIGTNLMRGGFKSRTGGANLMQTNQATWRMLARKMRDLMPVNAEVTDELQVLVLRLAVKEAERLHSAGKRRASSR